MKETATPMRRYGSIIAAYEVDLATLVSCYMEPYCSSLGWFNYTHSLSIFTADCTKELIVYTTLTRKSRLCILSTVVVTSVAGDRFQEVVSCRQLNACSQPLYHSSLIMHGGERLQYRPDDRNDRQRFIVLMPNKKQLGTATE